MHAPTPRALIVGALVFLVILPLIYIAAKIETLIHKQKP